MTLLRSRCSILLRSCTCYKLSPVHRYSVVAFKNKNGEISGYNNHVSASKMLYKYQINRNFSRSEFGSYLTTDFGPIAFCAKLLEFVHDSTGLPWWASIGLTTYTMRTMMLPLTFITIKNLQKLIELQPQILVKAMILEESMKHMSKEKAQKQFNREMRKFERRLYIEENCRPGRVPAAPIAQMPLWVCMSFALRNLAGKLPDFGQETKVLRPDLGEEGLLWVPNLLVADHTFILPVALVTIGYVLLKSPHQEMMKSDTPKNMLQTFKQYSPMVLQHQYGRYITYGILFLSFIAATQVPSCMSLYWVYSMSFGLVNRFLLSRTSVRRLLGVPKQSKN